MSFLNLRPLITSNNPFGIIKPLLLFRLLEQPLYNNTLTGVHTVYVKLNTYTPAQNVAMHEM
jgi:hypothetical protein